MPAAHDRDPHDDELDGGLDSEDIAEGVEELFGADADNDAPILQPDAPPPSE